MIQFDPFRQALTSDAAPFLTNAHVLIEPT
jgi:hypothetical protein